MNFSRRALFIFKSPSQLKSICSVQAVHNELCIIFLSAVKVQRKPSADHHKKDASLRTYIFNYTDALNLLGDSSFEKDVQCFALTIFKRLSRELHSKPSMRP